MGLRALQAVSLLSEPPGKLTITENLIVILEEAQGIWEQRKAGNLALRVSDLLRMSRNVLGGTLG